MWLMPANLETFFFPPNSYEKIFNNFMTLSDASVRKLSLDLIWRMYL